MSATWKSLELSVARELNLFFERHNLSPVQRKPVNGKVGEDIYTNELGLCIDVKHRQSIPKIYSSPTYAVIQYRNFLGTRIDNLDDLLINDTQPIGINYSSIVIERWWLHMQNHCLEHPELNLIPALVLHRPGTLRTRAVFLIHQTDRKKLQRRIKERDGKST
jgi:hypothetical protein